MQEGMVVSTWGIGPSYRNRVKYNIMEALATGYDNILDYVILTDYPEDFYDIAHETGKVKAIIDIREQNKYDFWSHDIEALPVKTMNHKEYAESYLNLLRSNKHFSYGIHRYSLPKIAEMGYTKLVFMDADVQLRYDRITSGELTEEQFWSHFDTPVNSVKGCRKESVYIDHPASEYPGHFLLKWAMAPGSSASMVFLQIASIVLSKMYEKYLINKPPYITQIDVLEGPFRYFNFRTPQDMNAYFHSWNEIVKIIFSNPYMFNDQACGGYCKCDYMPVSIANAFSELQVLDFPNVPYTRRIFFEDRYFLPPAVPGIPGSFIATDSVEEFLEKNAEYKEKIAWPHIEIA